MKDKTSSSSSSSNMKRFIIQSNKTNNTSNHPPRLPRLFNQGKEVVEASKMQLPELMRRKDLHYGGNCCSDNQQQPPVIDIQIVNSPGNIVVVKRNTNSESFLVARGSISSSEG